MAVSSQSGSRLLGQILPAAVKLWLHSQLDAVEGLRFDLEGSDRELLSGSLSAISLEASQLVYRGLNLTAASLGARDIKINLGQILRGKPLRLQQAFAVEGQVELTAADLRASAGSLLSEGLAGFWKTLLQYPGVGGEIEQYYGKAALSCLAIPGGQSHYLYLSEKGLSLRVIENGVAEAELASQLVVFEERWLKLASPQWKLASGHWEHSQALDEFTWDLGEHTCLHSVDLDADRLVCRGAVTVQP